MANPEVRELTLIAVQEGTRETGLKQYEIFVDEQGTLYPATNELQIEYEEYWSAQEAA